ncbi:unnamed protein product [Prorocentrum cordatum]|uniref:Uncharacterized protein n=1 Tax=Prorocentrum cordatum TaxID=2364126 RepID=A0ABN9PJP6_9DINO|nr:unnamed protein product [Polarella glacialis]
MHFAIIIFAACAAVMASFHAAEGRRLPAPWAEGGASEALAGLGREEDKLKAVLEREVDERYRKTGVGRRLVAGLGGLGGDGRGRPRGAPRGGAGPSGVRPARGALSGQKRSGGARRGASLPPQEGRPYESHAVAPERQGNATLQLIM